MLNNSLNSFLYLIAGLFIFTIFFVLLLKLLVILAVVGLVWGSYIWLRNKFFPNSPRAQKYKQFKDSFVFVSQFKQGNGRTAARNSETIKDVNEPQSAFDVNQSHIGGRIIDVDPENKN